MGTTFEARKGATPKAHSAPPEPPLTKIRLTDLRLAFVRQRNSKGHPQDSRPPEVLKILARFYPRFLKTLDNKTLAAIKRTRTARDFGISHRSGLSRNTTETGSPRKETGERGAVLLEGFQAPLIQQTGSVPLCLRRDERKSWSGTRHPSKVLMSR